MTTMAGGSPRLPDGTYIRYRDEQNLRRYARITGTDIGCTKYRIANRVGGWGEWLWVDGGWVFPGKVEAVSKQEATKLVATPELD